MKDLIEQYDEQNNIPRSYHTVITGVDYYDEFNHVQFRFESRKSADDFPICQYVRWRQDKGLIYRDKMRWFLPGDICFETFEAIERYLDSIKKTVDKTVIVVNHDEHDEIETSRDCNIFIQSGGKRFYIYVRSGRLEISGYNSNISIKPRAANLVHITEEND